MDRARARTANSLRLEAALCIVGDPSFVFYNDGDSRFGFVTTIVGANAELL
jgi:hypothetical protein